MNRVVLATIIVIAELSCTLGYSKAAILISKEDNDFGGAKGILQVQSSIDGTWRYINASNWDLRGAIVACKDLGYQGLDTFYASMPGEFPLTGKVSILQCKGTETQLSNCSNVIDTMTDERENYPMKVAAVSCTGFSSVRLTGMGAQHQGRVEVFYNGTWGSVCDDYWDQRDGEVVCKQLGYPGLLSLTGNIPLGSNSIQIVIDDSKCTENDTDIRLCQMRELGTSDCQPDVEMVGVICRTNNCPDLPDIYYGKIDNPGATTVTFTCDDGFTLLGNDTLTCNDRIWSSTVPMCVPSNITNMECNKTPQPFSRFGGIPRINGSSLNFECEDGYSLIGPNTAECLEYGVWETVPICLPRPIVKYQCVLPLDIQKAYEIDEKIELPESLCDNNSMAVGPSSLTCVMGEWNGPLPQCISKSFSMKIMSGSGHPADNPGTSHDRIFGNVPPGVVFGVLGVLGVGLLIVIVIIIAVIALCASRRNRKRNAVETETLHNLSAPLVINSDGEELGEADIL